MIDDGIKNINAAIQVSDKGYPLPIELRPLWRLGIMCLCIKVLGTTAHGLNVNKLRVATWMLNRPQLWDEYYKSMSSEQVKLPTINIDSNTDKAIELGMAKSFFSFSGDNVSLLETGNELLSLCDELDTFSKENDFLNTIKSKFTSSYINKIMGW